VPKFSRLRRAKGQLEYPFQNAPPRRSTTSGAYPLLVGWVGGKPRRHTRAPLAQRARSHRNIAPCAHLDPPGLDPRHRQTGKRISAAAITTRAAAITLLRKRVSLVQGNVAQSIVDQGRSADRMARRPPAGEELSVGAKELAKLLGHLVFGSQVIPGGRTYMQSMLSSFAGLEVDWRRGAVRRTPIILARGLPSAQRASRSTSG
jgi:hypothetical protein